MTDAVSINLEYNQFIYQCPREPEDYFCDLQDPCEDCELMEVE